MTALTAEGTEGPTKTAPEPLAKPVPHLTGNASLV